MKTNKGFALIVTLAIIVGILVVVGGAYYLGTKNNYTYKNEEKNNFFPQNNINNEDHKITSIKESTSLTLNDWKTYINKKYKFSFQYPSNYNDPVETQDSTSFELGPNESIYGPYVSYYPPSTQLTIDDFVNGTWGHSRSDTSEQILVAGQKAYKFSYETSLNGRGQPLVIYDQQVGFQDDQGGLFVISIKSTPEEKNNDISIFSRLISTFKFLK